MEKYRGNYNRRSAARIAKLIARTNNSFLTEQALNEISDQLKEEMEGPVQFVIAATPKAEYRDSDTITPDQLKSAVRINFQKASYLPVFTSPEELFKMKEALDEDECLYLCGKKDILKYLQLNQNKGAIINPVKSAVIVSPEELQGMIWAEEGKI